MRACRPLADLIGGADGLDVDLRAQVTGMAMHYAAAETADIALFEPEPRRFAAALLGAWQAGKRVWLSADRQPATLQALDQAMASTVAMFDAERDRLVLFTSGSTGAPQPIGKSLRQLDAEIAALEQVFGARIGDAAVQGTVSHQHIYGLLFRVLWPLAAGRAIGAPRIEIPGQWAAQAGERDILVATPSLLAQWPVHGDGPQPCLIVSSGGFLAPAIAERIAAQFNAPLVEVFGSTETGGIAWREPALDLAWQALPGIEWCIEDGLLALRSPQLPNVATWFRTSDRVAADIGGGFTLLGRADRIVKVGEKRVSLDGLEARLRETGWVDEVRALMVPGLRRGLAVVAVPSAAGRGCWLAGGRRALAGELRRALLAHLELAAVPRHWRFVEALPRNAQGKITDTSLAVLFRPRLPKPQGFEDGDGWRVLRIKVPNDLLFFDGHFDVASVVPGVVLLDWAIAQVEAAFGWKPPLAALEVLKFQKLVLPGALLSLRLEREAGAHAVSFAYESDEGSHASGRLRYAADASA